MVSRRELLATLATSAPLLAGCSVLNSPPPGVAIVEVKAANDTPDGQTIEFQIDRDDRTVVEETVTLQPDERASSSGYRLDTYEDLRVRDVYRVRYRLAGNEWRSTTYDGEEAPCRILEFKAHEHHDGQTVAGLLSYTETIERCGALIRTPTETR
ncbi:hypothetical protein [Halorhabdus salina]|uniref:hypothetical protein n=1 Tax=Halorhabdus salina TaxID=2750670 RepID=UPI0015EF5FB0|nr:hypothetical protein [Halorhabdus salina]